MNSRGILLIVLASFVFLIVLFGWTKHQIMYITALSWERTINIETLKTVRKYNRSYVPSGARNINHDEECSPRYMNINGHRTYVGQDCDDVYDYDIEEYVETRSVTSNGSNKTTPEWPTFTLSGPTGPYGTGQERKGTMNEQYTVYLRNKPTQGEEVETASVSMSRSSWSNFNVGDIVNASSNFGRVNHIEPLEK